MISRYERYIACARQPGLRDVQRRIMKQRTQAVVEVVERSGRSVRAELMTALVCAVDGAVVASLVGVGDGPRATARVVTVPLPAEARFSTTICWPSAAPILSATARAMMSLLPPGGSAITSVMGLFG